MARRATAQDVADLAGVSRSAVSLTLNGRADGSIGAAKQTAILEAARQLSYTPNAVALSLRQRRTRTIGLLTWPGLAGLPLALIEAVNAAAYRAGYLVLHADVRQRPDLVETLLDRQVDGFVVVAPELGDYPAPEALAAFPTVLVNCFDPGLGLTSVVPDEVGAGAAAARLLVRAGHTRIGVLAHAQATLRCTQRVLGIRRELEAAGLPEPLLVSAERDIAGGYGAALALLSADAPPTALVTTHERFAVGTALAAATLGRAVPRDLSVVTLDDGEDLATQLVPRFTVVERPDTAIASYALEALVEMLRGGAGQPRQLSFVCRVRDGGSVGPPGSALLRLRRADRASSP